MSPIPPFLKVSQETKSPSYLYIELVGFTKFPQSLTTDYYTT